MGTTDSINTLRIVVEKVLCIHVHPMKMKLKALGPIMEMLHWTVGVHIDKKLGDSY